MSARARQYLVALSLLIIPAGAHAQATWQPAAPPLVTAENETWFRAGDPIIWSGDYYYPAGAQRFFNPYQMVRSGSFRGIPLYTDATSEPYSIVFVPVAGGLMQPYERRRTGALAGTSGSTAPSFPPDIGAEGVATATMGVVVTDIAQAPAPPTRARAYDVTPIEAAVPAPVTSAAQRSVAATTGRVSAVAPTRIESVRKPAGLNALWVNYEGRRWFAAGIPVDKPTAGFTASGTYHGFPVYTRPGDSDTIYIPMVQGALLTPYKRR